MYLPFGGRDEPERILTRWLSDVPEGCRREAQLEYGDGEGQTESAFVTLRERSIRVADRSEAEGGNGRPRPLPDSDGRYTMTEPRCGRVSLTPPWGTLT